MEENIKLKVVENVWLDFLQEFTSGDLLHDQILIVADNLLLRGPNFDLIHQVSLQNHVH